jgi:hypothetical protein
MGRVRISLAQPLNITMLWVMQRTRFDYLCVATVESSITITNSIKELQLPFQYATADLSRLQLALGDASRSGASSELSTRVVVHDDTQGIQWAV